MLSCHQGGCLVVQTYRPAPPSSYWVLALKLLILVLGIYLSVMVLGRVFTWLLGFLFAIAKIVVFVALAFGTLHVLLRLLFRFDLYGFVFGNRFRR